MNPSLANRTISSDRLIASCISGRIQVRCSQQADVVPVRRPGTRSVEVSALGAPTMWRSDAMHRHSLHGLGDHVSWAGPETSCPCRSYVVLVATGFFSF